MCHAGVICEVGLQQGSLKLRHFNADTVSIVYLNIWTKAVKHELHFLIPVLRVACFQATVVGVSQTSVAKEWKDVANSTLSRIAVKGRELEWLDVCLHSFTSCPAASMFSTAVHFDVANK